MKKILQTIVILGVLAGGFAAWRVFRQGPRPVAAVFPAAEAGLLMLTVNEDHTTPRLEFLGSDGRMHWSNDELPPMWKDMNYLATSGWLSYWFVDDDRFILRYLSNPNRREAVHHWIISVDIKTGGLLWTQELPAGTAPLYVASFKADGVVFNLTLETDPADSYILDAINISDGKVMWEKRFQTTRPRTPLMAAGSFLLQSADEGTLIFDTHDGSLRRVKSSGLGTVSGDTFFFVRFEPDSGYQLMRLDLGDPAASAVPLLAVPSINPSDGFGFFGESLLLPLSTYEQTGDSLTAIDSLTGRERWKLTWPDGYTMATVFLGEINRTMPRAGVLYDSERYLPFVLSKRQGEGSLVRLAVADLEKGELAALGKPVQMGRVDLIMNDFLKCGRMICIDLPISGPSDGALAVFDPARGVFVSASSLDAIFNDTPVHVFPGNHITPFLFAEQRVGVDLHSDAVLLDLEKGSWLSADHCLYKLRNRLPEVETLYGLRPTLSED